MILDRQRVSITALARRTGWHLRPDGACKGHVCVPMPASAVDADGLVDVAVLAETLGMALVRDDHHGLWALGPEAAVSGRALVTAEAPDLELPDVRTGEDFSLSSLRGTKVVVVSWASW